jgi:predicted alpha/beta-hydrolase family hydrolase
MSRLASRSFKIEVPGAVDVTAKLDTSGGSGPSAALLLAHGSNNDLDHSLLAYLAAYLAETAGIAVLRFNFAYAERGADSPDSAPMLEAAFRAAHSRLASAFYVAEVPVFVGGKSLGGRVAAELVSRRVEGDGVTAVGLIELGYPLHAPGRSDRINLKPLRHIDVPSLFCIGSHDPFCDLDLLRPALPDLAVPGELYVVEGGDHSLALPRSSGREPDGAYEDVGMKVAAFVTKTAQGWRP